MTFSLVPKLHLGALLSSQLRCLSRSLDRENNQKLTRKHKKQSFADKHVPKCNLGTRNTFYQRIGERKVEGEILPDISSKTEVIV